MDFTIYNSQLQQVSTCAFGINFFFKLWAEGETAYESGTSVYSKYMWREKCVHTFYHNSTISLEILYYNF